MSSSLSISWPVGRGALSAAPDPIAMAEVR